MGEENRNQRVMEETEKLVNEAAQENQNIDAGDVEEEGAEGFQEQRNDQEAAHTDCVGEDLKEDGKMDAAEENSKKMIPLARKNVDFSARRKKRKTQEMFRLKN